MRHKLSGRTLGRPSHQRQLLYRTMVTDLLRHGHMRTTLAKAKEIQPLAERMITIGKRDHFNARRKAARFITDKTVVERLFTEVSPNFAEVDGGYTRITKLMERQGDAAPMAVIEIRQV